MARPLTCLLLLAWLALPVQAKDYGTQGQLFEIVEPSLLDIIKARASAMRRCCPRDNCLG